MTRFLRRGVPRLSALSFGVVVLATACRGDASRSRATAADTLVVYVAASLARPLQPVLDSFAARTGAVVQRESGASLEHARKITELGRVPDVLLLADHEVFPRLLMPQHATWYAQFARNRMVVAYTPRSTHAGEITAANWTDILQRGDVEVGRTDPNLAPAGYRTLLMLQLAERHAHRPGLAAALLANAPARNMRANAADLAALLAAGELDYIYEYQSVAEANGFPFVPLPADVDLGDPAHAADYGAARVEVRASPERSVEYVGEPILYGLSIPSNAPHPATARRFLAMMFSTDALRALRSAHVDMLGTPVVVGTGAPPEVNDAARSVPR
jgi:molybdate/tungstate transport system substrate-binding protein